MNQGTLRHPPQSAFAVLGSAGGLALWALHFTFIYAINAFACERGYEDASLFGLPWVPAMIGLATLVIVVPLLLILRRTTRKLGLPVTDGGQTEPRFTTWFAAAVAGYSLLAVLLQAAPSLVLPACGVGY